MSGSQQQKTQENQAGTFRNNSSPWDVQIPFLTRAFNSAQNALSNSQSQPLPNDFVAQFTPQQLSLFNSMYDFGSNNGAAGQTYNAGGSLTNNGVTGIIKSMADAANFRPEGGVDSNIDAATRYANNPAVSGMVDAAMRDARRNAIESTLPGIEQDAAGSGNLNSSRRAISEGLVSRGLAERAADVSANLRGDLFNRGLALAEGGRQFNTGTMLDALKMRGALSQGATGLGLGALGDSIAQRGALYDLAGKGAGGGQAANQAAIDNLLSRYSFGQSAQWDPISRYFGIIGANNWGGTQAGTFNTVGNKNAQTSPSLWQIIGGLANATGNFIPK